MTDQKTALVTGANRGIGLAIARQLSETHGFRVLAAARRLSDAEALAKELGGDLVGVTLDLSDPSTVEQQARDILSQHGPVDILVNNAGVLTNGSALDIRTADLQDSMNINALSPFALIRIFGEAMKASGWGRIVNVSSGWGSFDDGLSGPAAYSISKATLNAITLSFAQAMGSAVKINAACPGWVRTRMGGQMADRSVEEGADTPVWLATLPDDGPTGGFFRDRRLIEW